MSYTLCIKCYLPRYKYEPQFSENVVAAQIDGVLASNLLLLDETSIVSGTVDFADNLLVADVTSDSGILDGCNLLQVCKSRLVVNLGKESFGLLTLLSYFS